MALLFAPGVSPSDGLDRRDLVPEEITAAVLAPTTGVIATAVKLRHDGAESSPVVAGLPVVVVTLLLGGIIRRLAIPTVPAHRPLSITSFPRRGPPSVA